MIQDPKPLRIIGIMGKAGAGKDTACGLLQVVARGANLKAVKMAFADPIKKVCSDVYCFAENTPREAFYGTQEQKDLLRIELDNHSGREVMQFIGTGGYRVLTNDIWVKYLIKHAQISARYGADLVLVSDVRHGNEADAIHKHHGIVVRIQRGDDNGTNVGIPGHASELEQDSIDADVEILNNGTIDELKHALRSLI